LLLGPLSHLAYSTASMQRGQKQLASSVYVCLSCVFMKNVATAEMYCVALVAAC